MAGEVVPFSAPSQRPDEPVTTGVDVGDGAGSSILRSVPRSSLLEDARRAAATGRSDSQFIYELARQSGWL